MRCGAVLLVALVACGSGRVATDADAPVDGPPDAGAARYASAADFDTSACAPGSLAEVPTTPGIFHVTVDVGGGSTFAARHDGAASLLVGRTAQIATASDDARFWRAETPGEGVRALLLCRRDLDGTLRGRYARCPNDECFELEAWGARVDPLAEPAAAGLTLLGEFAQGWDEGISVNVRVDGELAYLARYGDGLRIVDVADPASPQELAHLPTENGDPEIYNDVKLLEAGGGRYAVLASSQRGAVVVDVTTPSTPVVVAHLGTPADVGRPIDVHTLFVEGTRAYLANTELGLEIYELATPTAPVRLGGFAPAGFTYLHDLYVEGDRAYLNIWERGMAIVDLSAPAAPVEVGRFANYGESTSHSTWVTTIGDRRVAVHGDEQIGAHVHVVDVTEGTAGFLSVLGEWQTRPAVSVHNIMGAGDRAYVAHYQDGIRVLDLSVPTDPRQVAHFQTWPGAAPGYGEHFFEGAVGLDLDLARGRIYVADTHRGLLILAITP